MCRTPALAPGASVPFTVTVLVVPVPPSVPPEFTVVAELRIEPLTRSTPASTVVAPV